MDYLEKEKHVYQKMKKTITIKNAICGINLVILEIEK